MKRRRLSRRGSKRKFKRGLRTQTANLRSNPMRGGFRI